MNDLQCTNLQEAYKKAAVIFVQTVVLGEPEHIMKKLEKCPIIKNVGVSGSGNAVVFTPIGFGTCELFTVPLPNGVRIQETVEVKYEVKYEKIV